MKWTIAPQRSEIRDALAFEIDYSTARRTDDPTHRIHRDLFRHITWDKTVLIRVNGDHRIQLEADDCYKPDEKEDRNGIFRDPYRGIGKKFPIRPAFL